jgi:hypothetical protein
MVEVIQAENGEWRIGVWRWRSDNPCASRLRFQSWKRMGLPELAGPFKNKRAAQRAINTCVRRLKLRAGFLVETED